MIRIATNNSVSRLLEKVTADPARYKRVVLCSPMIDAPTCDTVIAAAMSLRGSRCAMRIITGPETAASLRARASDANALQRTVIQSRVDLHAKIYLAIGRCYRATEAIVTSVNLTVAGLSRAAELGVVAVPTSDSGQQLISEISSYLHTMANPLRGSPPQRFALRSA